MDASSPQKSQARGINSLIHAHRGAATFQSVTSNDLRSRCRRKLGGGWYPTPPVCSVSKRSVGRSHCQK